jgi:hypothetical protein
MQGLEGEILRNLTVRLPFVRTIQRHVERVWLRVRLPSLDFNSLQPTTKPPPLVGTYTVKGVEN